jgi:hypothetical protein
MVFYTNRFVNMAEEAECGSTGVLEGLILEVAGAS